MARTAAGVVQSLGGVEATRVFTRIWLALFGLWDVGRAARRCRPRWCCCPRWVPLNVYDFACWARQTIVPLTVVSHPAAAAGRCPSASTSCAPARRPCRGDRLLSWAGAFQRLDRCSHAYARHPVRPLRRLAMRRAAEWILARQEADGSWGGIQPPWVYSLLALHLLGYPLDHPCVRAGLDGLEGFVVREETPTAGVRRLEACQSPVWDTASR